jgi:methylosome protein 50
VVASGGDDGSVDLWFISSNGARGGSNGATKAAAGAAGPGLEHTQAKVLHDASVTSLAAAPAVAQLASASADGTLRLWDCGQLLACTGQLGSSGGKPLNALAWTGEPAVLASAGDDGRLCLWDTRQLGSAPSAAAAVGAPALSLAVLGGGSGGKQQLVVGDLLGRVSVFDARNCSTPLQQRQLHGDAVHALAATSSSTGGSGGSGTVASGSDDGSILLLDCASLAASRQLAPAQQEGQASRYVRALAWSGGSRSSNGGGSQQQQLYCGSWSKEVSRVPL